MKNLPTLALAGAALIFFGNPLTGRAQLQVAPNDLSAVRAYPNPWRVDRDATASIIFDGLPVSTPSTVRIFTISGELVRTLGGAQRIEWDLRNSRGERV